MAAMRSAPIDSHERKRKDENLTKAEIERHQSECGQGLEGEAAILGSVGRP
jgi:hypothetical protein